MRATLTHLLQRAWLQRGPLACALWPLSQLYRLLAAARGALYRVGVFARDRLPVPVVVVGNVVAGGAGKTPTTLAIACHLRDAGWHPGIVSRGHGRSTGDVRAVQPDSDPREVGDEPLLLRRRADVPVFVGRRRAEAGRALLAAHPQVNVLLCDDGLQHAALARDLEICVFDARGIGNGWLLPAGPLREPWPRAVDLVLATEPQAAPLAAAEAPFVATRQLAAHAVRANGERVPLAALQGTPLTAVAAIARPQAFFAMLRAAGLTLERCVTLPDHDPYEDFARRRGVRVSETLVCTEKDAPKLWRERPDALAVGLQLALPAGFLAALEARLARLAGRRAALHFEPS